MTHSSAALPPAASAGDGSYPRPQLVRSRWHDLGGTWEFTYDDADLGYDQRWWEQGTVFGRSITVPFPPESTASGIGDTSFHPVVWYRRLITRADLVAAGLGVQGDRMTLHFGAVDYEADVWLAGHHLGRHHGGHTPFSVDISPVIAGPDDTWTLVVRATDNPLDVAQPRGKQDWQLEPHGIWYHRTTGIWQPVWIEAVPSTSISFLNWTCDLPAASVELNMELSTRPSSDTTVRVRLAYGTETLADVQVVVGDPRIRVHISLPQQRNGQAYEALLWSPENPRLIDATVTVADADRTADHVSSYLGLRSAGWADGHFMLNDRPYFLRAVLAQGYWPDTHLAAPSADALRAEAQLIADLGFNAVRIHEKVEDPRFLYWTDRLGILVWGEMPSAFEFSPTAVTRTTHEWTDVIRRDMSHPSIVSWVPINESWGVQHAAHDAAQRHFIQALYHLTKSLDPYRPVVSNDGWEHADSDLWTIHDYGVSGAELHANYTDASVVHDLLSGIGPLGRRMKLLDGPERGQPVIVSEFGGISYAPDRPGDSWGYVTAASDASFETLLRDMFTALQSSPVLAGFCYTQLTDTQQEANGLADPRRRPKLSPAIISAIVSGAGLDTSSQRRPKRPVEQASVTVEAEALLRAEPNTTEEQSRRGPRSRT